MCKPLISQLKTALSSPDGKDKPVFGICLGNQLTGLAAGCESYKLPFGNRGQNQPVINLETKHAFITPQNHGFAIDTSKLPSDWTPLFVNANDGTNEGIMHKSKPIFTAQFHPEANGGPNDTAFLFDMFLETIKQKSSRPVQVCGIPCVCYPCLLPGALSVATTSLLVCSPSLLPHSCVHPTTADARAQGGAAQAAGVQGTSAGQRRPVHRPGGRVRLQRQPGHQGAQGARAEGGAHEPQHRVGAGEGSLHTVGMRALLIVSVNDRLFICGPSAHFSLSINAGDLHSLQTNVDDKALSRADNVYFLPVTPDFIEMVRRL